MYLKALTRGKVTGTGTVQIEHKFGGAIITANEDRGFTSVIVKRTDENGKPIFDVASKSSLSAIQPISTEGASRLYFEIRHGFAQLYEWVE